MNNPVEIYEDEAYTEDEYEELPLPRVQPTHFRRTKITAVPMVVHNYEKLAFWKVRLAAVGIG
jgi:hypothetical protein